MKNNKKEIILLEEDFLIDKNFVDELLKNKKIKIYFNENKINNSSEYSKKYKNISDLENKYKIEIFLDEKLKKFYTEKNNENLVKKLYLFLKEYYSKIKAIYNFLDNQNIVLFVSNTYIEIKIEENIVTSEIRESQFETKTFLDDTLKTLELESEDERIELEKDFKNFTEIKDYLALILNKFLFFTKNNIGLLKGVNFSKIKNFIDENKTKLVSPKDDILNDLLTDIDINIVNTALNGLESIDLEKFSAELEDLFDLILLKLERIEAELYLIDKNWNSDDALLLIDQGEEKFLEDKKEKILNVLDNINKHKKQNIKKLLGEIFKDLDDIEDVFDFIKSNMKNNSILKDIFDFLLYSLDSKEEKTFEDYEIEKKIKFNKVDFIKIKTDFFTEFNRIKDDFFKN